MGDKYLDTDAPEVQAGPSGAEDGEVMASCGWMAWRGPKRSSSIWMCRDRAQGAQGDEVDVRGAQCVKAILMKIPLVL